MDPGGAPRLGSFFIDNALSLAGCGACGSATLLLPNAEGGNIAIWKLLQIRYRQYLPRLAAIRAIPRSDKPQS